MRKLMISALLATLLVAEFAAQQKPKGWPEWSKEEAERILNDSPWAQTQVETNTSEMTYSPTAGAAPATTRANSQPVVGIRSEQTERNKNRAQEGAYNQAVNVTYRVRFLSAKPIREAFAALILLRQGKTEPAATQVKTQMQQFVDGNYHDYIVVTVSYEGSDQRLTAKAFQDLGAAVADTLKNNTYLERSDGKRVFLMDYRAPIEDGLGAKFVFLRIVDEKPFLSANSGEVRFYSEVGPNVKLDRRFKVANMLYQGILEY
jgi:hypothetical protein